MALHNWPMTLIGYPPHARSGVRVVGVSHMSTFSALRVAEELGLYTGWLLAEGSQPQLEGVRAGQATWAALSQLFSQSKVVQTEGLAQGTLRFAAATPAAGQPPADRPLAVWAESHGQPWLEVVDNELAYWGGLSDGQLDRLLVWFCCQRPFDFDWRKVKCEQRARGRLRHGLFEHGWTRNLALVRPERRAADLWAGVHQTCRLDRGSCPLPSRVQTGLRLTVDFGEIACDDLAELCPLVDETGKAGIGRGSGLWQQ